MEKLCERVFWLKHTRFWKSLALASALCACTLTAAASPLSDVRTVTERSLSGGADLTVSEATVGERPQVMYTVEADSDDYELMIGGPVLDRELVQDMTPITDRDAEAVAALNGDHFSFKTGIPMGMSISDGEIVTSPIPAYNADDYYFHALGITADGEVLTGENPTLYMQYTVGDHTCTVDRINRTRESWEGGQICLFTPRYGESTDTDFSGVDVVLRVEEGKVAVGTMRATVVEIDEDGDAPLEEGYAVLSIHALRYEEVENLAVGDELVFAFEFDRSEWNDVTFAVGGNLTAVANGEVQLFDYTVGAFTAAAPRSALGIRADGKIVLAAVDGRSDEAGGMTANEMAAYMAEDLDCEYAILLDGGGSTAMAAKDENGVMATVNVPSEERPVGNGVLLVRKDAADNTMWIVCGVTVAVVLAAGAAAVVLLLRKTSSQT